MSPSVRLLFLAGTAAALVAALQGRPAGAGELPAAERDAIARAHGLVQAGRRAAGFAVLDSLLAVSAVRGDAALRLAVLTTKGGHHSWAGEASSAEPLLTEALALATAERDSALEGGTLQLVGLPSFNADPGDEFTILTAASVSGIFGFVTFTGFPPGTQLEVVYNPTSVVVRVTASAGIEAPLAAPEALPAALAFTAIAAPDGAAAFELALPVAADAVTVSLYDIAGRQVARLHDGPLASGWHRLAIPQVRLARGVYFGRSEIATDGQREARTARVVLMK